MTATIQLNGVSKFFGNIIALKDISFEAHKGEVTALLGDNGAGKSTLIKCLSGVHAPDEGEIIIEGKPIKFTSPRQAAAAGRALFQARRPLDGAARAAQAPHHERRRVGARRARVLRVRRRPGRGPRFVSHSLLRSCLSEN